jgi:hypothetical protein
MDATVLIGNLIFSLVGIIVFGLFCWGGGYLFILWSRNRHREEEALHSVMLQITLPRENEIKIDAAEQLFASLAAIEKHSSFHFLHNQPHLSFEIVGMPGEIHFYVNVPKKLQDLVEKQINGAYPDADIQVVTPKSVQRKEYVLGDEYNIFSENGQVAFASLKLKGPDYAPIKMYKDLAVDPLSSITSVLAKMTDGEGAAIQIMVSPAGHKWQHKGREYIAKTKKNEANPDTAHYNSDAKELEAVETKLSKPGFNVVVRIVVSSSTHEAAEAHLHNIETAFAQFAGINSFTHNTHYFKSLFMTDFIYRYMPMRGQTSVLSSEELATIFHLPNKSITTPNIVWLTSKRAPAPAQIPTEGLFLGKSVFRGMSKPIYMGITDRRRHMYIIGKTGTGKSEFLKDMIMQDIRNGQGVAVVDPHGDLVEDILPQVPTQRAEDVILFDPSDVGRPLGINMIEAQTEDQKHLITTSVIGLMYKLFDPNKTGIIGPRFEHAVRNAILTVMAEPGNTFIEVMRVLTDQNFVQELLPKVQVVRSIKPWRTGCAEETRRLMQYATIFTEQSGGK